MALSYAGDIASKTATIGTQAALLAALSSAVLTALPTVVEAMIPAMEAIIKYGGQYGVKEIVYGMAHRGRLNILHSVFAKPLAAICAEMRSEGASGRTVGWCSKSPRDPYSACSMSSSAEGCAERVGFRRHQRYHV